ncbi:SUPPRESSOR OF GAMMA RESPONSE 1 [Camellia lanceoleosa]|uniref:SUPPRESSOR OF GAMMA RESPONSE 1 n=1 Tax=Camellia lanceoleosa TaxID=1840588 RepID=A0ACC0J5C2_9ERIC|nr:SUPPRESSOR OF GAMMA RESPONSE 1 [Camellia lanceoleosa]
MARSWLIDCKGIATKVKNANLSPAFQIKDSGANRECPKCHYRIDNSDVSHEWPGFPAGVKFDPSDIELLEHLAAKCGVGNSKPHMFIDEFIPTVDKEGGICYTHPENLPGVKIDGSSVHFFHRTINAYATGQRKRRRIQNQHIRWHKTGKTKRVMENGVQKGCKKIMVLYKTSKKGSKPDKSNWVMHQYHLGTDEDEIGQFVVSKIFSQPQKQIDNSVKSHVIEDSDTGTIQTSPRTPKTNTPNPPRPGKSFSCDDMIDDYAPESSAQQEAEFATETSHPSSSTPHFKDELETQTWLAGESQALDGNGVDDSLLCNEIFSSYSALSGLNHGPFSDVARFTNDVPVGDRNPSCGIADLENLDLGTPPDFQLADLQFGSQESILGCILLFHLEGSKELAVNFRHTSGTPCNQGGSGTTSKKRAREAEGIAKGLVDMAVEFGSFFKKTNTTMEEIAHRIGLRAATLIVKDAERVDLFFSLPEEEKMEWAKKKVALFLQKLKKYELPELPLPRHDPELLTPEQLQAIKKIGFKNKNYVPVGVRGVFGGVVQNMHLHWKFHETVQVCCDNFPKEKIKEMATMLARLSGEVEPSRNLRRSEPGEASDQEELNRFIAEIEDAADKEWAEEEAAEKEELSKIRYWSRDDLGGRFRRSELLRSEDSVDATRGGGMSWKDAQNGRRRTDDSDDESDEEWDSNGVGDVSDYESDTADHDRARYKFKAPGVERGKQNGVGRANGNKGFKRNVEAKFSENLPKDDSGSDAMLSDVEDVMWQSDSEGKQDLGKSEATRNDYRSSSDEEEDFLQMKRDEKNGVAVVNHFENDSEDFDESLDKMNLSRAATEKHNKIHIANNNEAFDKNAGANFGGKIVKEKYESEDLFGDSDIAMWESDAEEDVDSETLRLQTYDHRSNSEDDDYTLKKDGKDVVNDKKKKTPKQVDETWDSD